MKTRMVRPLIMMLALLALVPALTNNAQEIVRITNGEWLPLFGENLLHYGVCPRIVTDAFTLEGVTVEYGFYPWNRGYMLSETGIWDGTIGWPYSDERAATHYYSAMPISEGEWVFFHRKDTELAWSSVDDLKRYTFGLTVGDWALDGDDAVTMALKDKTLKSDYAPTDEANFQKLTRKRIDVFPQQLDVGLAQIQALAVSGELTRAEADNITYTATPYRTMPLYLLLTKKKPRNAELMEKLNTGMQQLKESGAYDRYWEESRQGAYIIDK